MTIPDTIREWQRLDDAAFIAERSLESAPELYCAGRGPVCQRLPNKLLSGGCGFSLPPACSSSNEHCAKSSSTRT